MFPAPHDPRDRHEGRRHSSTEAQKKAVPAVKQADRRQSMAFSILNTPKKLGNSLLRKAASKKAPPKPHPTPQWDPPLSAHRHHCSQRCHCCCQRRCHHPPGKGQGEALKSQCQ